MRLPLVVIAVALALVLGGCGKKSSKEYFDARRAYDSLVDQEGDDAYLLPEMANVSAALGTVPQRAIEYPLAQELIAKIATEKARVEKERAEIVQINEKPLVKPQLPDSQFTPKPVAVTPDTQAADGPPTGGMLEAVFKEKYGSCVTGPEEVKVEGQSAPAYASMEAPACQQKLGVTVPTKFFFIKGALAGRLVSTTTTTRTILDGGGATTIQVPGERYVGIPGAPLPPGLGGPATPAPAPGTLAPTSTGDGLKPANSASDFGHRPTP